MSGLHIVRVGMLGQIGRFRPVDGACYRRGSRVIVRTGRGLEIGEVLREPEGELAMNLADGDVVRGMTVADELLAARLEQNRHTAFTACAEQLATAAPEVTLMEVEHLFDGQTLVFYFLGDPTPKVERLTADLAEAYDAQAQMGRFAATLAEGCGPGCGTEDAAGHGCTSCAVGCAVAGACSTHGK